MGSTIGNHAMGRLVREAPAAIPRSSVSALGNHAIGRIARSVLARNGGADAGAPTLDPHGGTLPPGGLPDSALPDGGMAPPATAQQAPQQTPAAPVGESAQPIPATPAPPDRDTLVRDAINEVLRGYENLAVLIPVNMPPTPTRRRAARPAAGAAPGAADAGASADPVAAGAPAEVTFASPYFINRSRGDGGAAGGQHGLGAPGVRAWFNPLPNAVKVGKGSSAQLQTAMQQAVDQGLLNGTWPPTSQTLVAFMREVGLGVDCSGFVYLALMAADAALTGAGMAGLTSPQTSSIGNSGSQSIGRTGGTRVTRPGDLRIGDIIQMAPNAAHAVGHIRILTSVRASTDWVEYDTAESTTRVGSGPQASTWRIPAGGPMDTAHLEVRDNTTGAWSAETTRRPSTYWRRLAAAAPVAAPAPAGAAPAARAIARRRTAGRVGAQSTSSRRIARDQPRAGGWNEADRDVTGTWRIQITGLTQGLAGANRHAATAEEAQHRAVAVVPKAITAANLEVLLHFHGNNLGGRERAAASDSGMAKGTVRDVEADLIPQQLAASGRNIIGILPQGSVDSGQLDSKFGITDTRAYVTAVLAQVVTHVNRLDPTKNLQALAPVRIDVSGHSGGGPAAVDAASGLQATAQSSDQDWVAAPPLMLFDAINGINELNLLTGLVRGWLDEDKRRLRAKPESEAATLLSRRGLKLRSTYTAGVYHATNSSREPRTYQYPQHPPVTVPASLSLEAKLDAWFAANGSDLGALAPTLRGQYVVEHVSGSHDFTVGAGSLQSGPRTAVPGVTQAPGAPARSTQAPANATGNLAQGLGRLSPADQVAAPAPAPAASAPPAQAAPAQSPAPGGSNDGARRSDELDGGVPGLPDGASLPGGVARSLARSAAARRPPGGVGSRALARSLSGPRIARQPRSQAPSASNDDIARQFGAVDWEAFKAQRQAANDTVFGQPVQGLLPVFLAKLRGAENAVAASQNGGQPITAQDWRTRFGVTSVGGLRFNASGGPASTHGWGLAIDVNYRGAPFVMHEAREQTLDAQLGPVYHRIAWLILYRESAIPQAITQVARSADTRAWYRTLRAESDAMRRYFQMMRDPNDINWNTVYEDMNETIWGHLGVGAMPNPGDPQRAQVQVRELLRAQMARDYAILGAQGGQDVGGGVMTPNVPGVRRSDESAADRPFAGRDPGEGFMDLHEEVVVALRAQSGVRWGAIDFGGESGDVMHFDLRGHLESKRAAAVAALQAAQADAGAPAADGGTTVARSVRPNPPRIPAGAPAEEPSPRTLLARTAGNRAVAALIARQPVPAAPAAPAAPVARTAAELAALKEDIVQAIAEKESHRQAIESNMETSAGVRASYASQLQATTGWTITALQRLDDARLATFNLTRAELRAANARAVAAGSVWDAVMATAAAVTAATWSAEAANVALLGASGLTPADMTNMFLFRDLKNELRRALNVDVPARQTALLALPAADVWQLATAGERRAVGAPQVTRMNDARRARLAPVIARRETIAAVAATTAATTLSIGTATISAYFPARGGSNLAEDKAAWQRVAAGREPPGGTVGQRIQDAATGDGGLALGRARIGQIVDQFLATDAAATDEQVVRHAARRHNPGNPLEDQVVRHYNTFHAARAPAPAAPAPAAPAAPGGPHTELEHTPPASGPYPMIPPLNEAEMLADLTDPGEDDTATA